MIIFSRFESCHPSQELQMLEAIIAVYTLGIVLFFTALLRDKYVELNKVVILVYFVASLLWPIAGLIYVLDSKK